jgi:hypothetical protein
MREWQGDRGVHSIDKHRPMLIFATSRGSVKTDRYEVRAITAGSIATSCRASRGDTAATHNIFAGTVRGMPARSDPSDDAADPTMINTVEATQSHSRAHSDMVAAPE